MGEHQKIVVENYPVDNLPLELRLRLGLADGAMVTITVEPEPVAVPQQRAFSEFFGKSGRAHNDPVADIRQLRDEWDD